MKTRTTCIAALATGVLATSAATATAATDLNPPPPGFYTCQTNGSGTVCHGKHSDSYQGGYDGTGPQGFDILENGTVEETAARYYDRDGSLVRRDLHDRWPNIPQNILYNSVTGKSVHYTTDGNELDTFTIPGDFDSIVADTSGNGYTVTAPGGLLIKDAGVLDFAPDGSVLELHGPKMLFLGQNEALCQALD
jgi:hypothetical protein